MSNFSQKARQNLVLLQKGRTIEQGVSLYLAVIIMSILLAIVLGMSTILFYQLKMVGETGSSVVAFYAADTGIERALYDENNCLQMDSLSCGLILGCKIDVDGDGLCDGLGDKYDPDEVSLGGSGAKYKTQFVAGSPNGFRSKGSFRKTKRAIEITSPAY